LVHDSQRLVSLLQALQDATCCNGFESLAQHSHIRNRRTLYRWRHSFGKSLLAVPSFSLERLGLARVHLVLRNPTSAWIHFPYAVEHAWLTGDFAQNSLYLHCIVPSAHKKLFQQLLHECQAKGWCSQSSALWTVSGWQELPDASTGNPPLDLPVVDDAEVLQEFPLVVPAIFESWNHSQSLADIWTASSSRIGDRLRNYLPRGRIYRVNGRMHVRHAFDMLSKYGLFRQYLIRYEGWQRESLEIFVFFHHAGDWLPELCEAIRPVAIAIETYNGTDGSALLRVVGREGALRQLLEFQEELGHHGGRIFLRNVNREKEEHVRFCYEFLFDAKTKQWVFPHDAIIEHMKGEGKDD
jgi:hypothetical protein